MRLESDVDRSSSDVLAPLTDATFVTLGFRSQIDEGGE